VDPLRPFSLLGRAPHGRDGARECYNALWRPQAEGRSQVRNRIDVGALTAPVPDGRAPSPQPLTPSGEQPRLDKGRGSFCPQGGTKVGSLLVHPHWAGPSASARGGIGGAAF
jgi:hypothetical protein